MFTLFRVLFNIACVCIILGAVFQSWSLIQQQAQTVSQTAAPLQTQNPTTVPDQKTARPSPIRQSRPGTPSVTQPETKTEAQTEPPVAEERTPPLTPTGPTSGLPSDTAMTIQQCRHDGSIIGCWGFISLSTDIPTQECFENSMITDDLGNQYYVLPQFSGGGLWSTLIPSTKNKFEFHINDPHPAVQSLNMLIRIREKCNQLGDGYHPQNDVVFTSVPVQK